MVICFKNNGCSFGEGANVFGKGAPHGAVGGICISGACKRAEIDIKNRSGVLGIVHIFVFDGMVYAEPAFNGIRNNGEAIGSKEFFRFLVDDSKRFAFGKAAKGAGFRCFFGCFGPTVFEGGTLGKFAAFAGLRVGAGGFCPGMSGGLAFGFGAERTGFRFGAGGFAPFVFAGTPRKGGHTENGYEHCDDDFFHFGIPLDFFDVKMILSIFVEICKGFG